MSLKLFSLWEEDEPLAQAIAKQLETGTASVELHKFPDQETLVRIKTGVEGSSIALVCSLLHPDPKLISLIFFAKTAKDLGAKSVSLIAPYLAYMRQDKQFNPGEGVSSRYFAELISNYFDALVTVDAHLHRYHSLAEIYDIPAFNLSAAPAIAKWISKHVEHPFIIGPDAESEQWVAAIAKQLHANYVILKKTRYGDEQVSMTLPDFTFSQEKSLVLLDDIISSGKTLLEAINLARTHVAKRIICIGVHAVFSASAYQQLMQTGAEIVTTNSIYHPSNQIDLSRLISDNIFQL